MNVFFKVLLGDFFELEASIIKKNQTLVLLHRIDITSQFTYLYLPLYFIFFSF